MARHVLAGPTHNRWNNALAPILIAASGDEIVFVTMAADDGQIDPDDPQLGYDIGRVHPVTGPVYVTDAEPGDALEVTVLDVQIGDWGWQLATPDRGFLKDIPVEPQLVIVRIDKELGVARYPSGLEIPLDPFPGIIGVAPAEPGEFRTFQPGPFGGNIDVRELRPGCSLRLPVFVPGALLSVGDVHAGQGDGEVSLNGIETTGRVTVGLTLHKGMSLDRPHIITPTHYGLLGVGPTADDACRDALQAALRLLADQRQLPLAEAYAVLSGCADIRINQLVNHGALGARVMIPRTVLGL